VKQIVLVLSMLLTCLPSAMAQSQQAIRVKCGGPAYTDSKGQVWSADYGFNSFGTVSGTTGPVNGTNDPTLYQHGRYSDAGTPALIYSLPASNGNYTVNLYFAELNRPTQWVGGRVFNVKMQDNLVFQNLDIFAAVGANAALIKSSNIIVANGLVQIEFDNVVNTAKVEAIEILPTGLANGPQLILNFKYPDGSPVIGTLNYTIANSTINVGGNVPLVNGQATCSLISAPNVLGLIGSLQANLSLTNNAGHTLWQFSFTINPSTVNFGAVQSSSMNVVVQKL